MSRRGNSLDNAVANGTKQVFEQARRLIADDVVLAIVVTEENPGVLAAQHAAIDICGLYIEGKGTPIKSRLIKVGVLYFAFILLKRMEPRRTRRAQRRAFLFLCDLRVLGGSRLLCFLRQPRRWGPSCSRCPFLQE